MEIPEKIRGINPVFISINRSDFEYLDKLIISLYASSLIQVDEEYKFNMKNKKTALAPGYIYAFSFIKDKELLSMSLISNWNYLKTSLQIPENLCKIINKTTYKHILTEILRNTNIL